MSFFSRSLRGDFARGRRFLQGRALVAGLLLAACSTSAPRNDGVDGGPLQDDGGSPAGLTLDEFLSRFMDADCARDRRCYASALIPSCDEAAGLPLGEGGSVLGYDPLYFENATAPLIRAAVARGTLIYHAEKASQCLDLITNLACDTWVYSCAVFEGTVSAGSNCVINYECAGGTYCYGAKPTACQPGTCVAPASANTACGLAQCASGLTCVNSLCVIAAKLHEACNSNGSPKPPCDGVLLCDAETASAAGTCKTYAEMMTVPVGGGCDPKLSKLGGTFRGPYCQQGLACVTQPGGTGLCAARVGSGQACGTARPNQCPDGEVCAVASGAVSGTCAAPAAAGQPCASVTCAPGLVCSTVCQPRQANGGPCTAPAAGMGICESTWCGADSKCAAPGTDCQ